MFCHMHIPSKQSAQVPHTSPQAHDPGPAGLRRWVGGGLVLLVMGACWIWLFPTRESTTEQQRAIAHTERKNLEPVPQQVSMAGAAQVALPSVVRIDVSATPTPGKTSVRQRIGSGVVMSDKGTILTSLPLVRGANAIQVTFATGLKSVATLSSTQAKTGLAVLQAHTIPDDLVPATQRSTAGLQLGEPLLVIGFPQGMGPSVSAGVLSGLQRRLDAPNGKHTMERMVQFDITTQPGHMGAPLITRGGEVIGIVTVARAPGISFAVPMETAGTAVGPSPF